MGRQVYPDMDYQEKIYNELVLEYQGKHFTKRENYGLPNGSMRCICPQCGQHGANFFRARDNNTFLMTCMNGCGLKKTLHNIVMDYGKQELKDEWKANLDRINFINYGTAMPIKNAVRPKGSKTTKRSPKINAELKYEIHTRRSRSTL